MRLRGNEVGMIAKCKRNTGILRSAQDDDFRGGKVIDVEGRIKEGEMMGAKLKQVRE